MALFSPSLKKLASFVSDQDPLKSVVFVPSEVEDTYFCLSGGLGEVLQVHLVNLKDSKHV